MEAEEKNKILMKREGKGKGNGGREQGEEGADEPYTARGGTTDLITMRHFCKMCCNSHALPAVSRAGLDFDASCVPATGR